MTIRTYDLALGDLSEHSVPLEIADPVGHIERFVGQVVELKDHDIRLATIHAWVPLEIFNYQRLSFFLDQRPPFGGVLLVPFLVPSVMLFLVRGSTGTAIALAATQRLAMPGEVFFGFGFGAARASSFHR
jgi:hypothetical protein